METEISFSQYIKSKGFNLTKERLDLFRGIRKQKGHFSVETLLQQLKNTGYKVSRDTIYRNLPLLLESGVIQQSFRTSRDTVYEVAEGKEHHDHMFCRLCGNIYEFKSDVIEQTQEQIAKESGFKLEHHCHQLVGVCVKCQK